MPKLENWSIILGTTSAYAAPELIRYNMRGTVFNYDGDRFNNGDTIVTSHITELNLEYGYVRTKNSKYQLGSMSEKYAEYLKSNNKTLKSFLVSTEEVL